MSNFELMWLGYISINNIAIGYSWDDLSSWSYADQDLFFNKISIAGLTLSHKYNDNLLIAYPVLIS